MTLDYPAGVAHIFTEEEYWAALDAIGISPTTRITQHTELGWAPKGHSENMVSLCRGEGGVLRAELGSNLYIEDQGRAAIGGAARLEPE